MKRYLECGKIVTTHGIRGEVKVQPWCDSPEELCGLQRLYRKDGTSLEVEGARVVKGMALLKLRGVDDLDTAVTLRGQILYIDREESPPLEDGVYFIQDLIGLAVQDADTGQEYGKLSSVFATGANDVYEVTAEGGKVLLVPAIKDVIVQTDLEAGRILIRPLEGLFDED